MILGKFGDSGELYFEINLITIDGEDEFFDIYEGKVNIDGREYVIPVHVSLNIPDILMGCQWLDLMELVVNKSQGILSLSNIEEL